MNNLNSNLTDIFIKPYSFSCLRKLPYCGWDKSIFPLDVRKKYRDLNIYLSIMDFNDSVLRLRNSVISEDICSIRYNFVGLALLLNNMSVLSNDNHIYCSLKITNFDMFFSNVFEDGRFTHAGCDPTQKFYIPVEFEFKWSGIFNFLKLCIYHVGNFFSSCSLRQGVKMVRNTEAFLSIYDGASRAC